MAARPRNVAPPLKSMSTKFSASGACVAASPTTRVRSSSLFPEPVAPMQSPCGPLPPWADSLRSSSTGAPRSSTPIGTRSRSTAAASHRARTARIPAGPGRRPTRPGNPGAARAAASAEIPAGPVARQPSGQRRGLRRSASRSGTPMATGGSPSSTRSTPSPVEAQAHHRRGRAPPGGRPDPQHGDARGRRPRAHAVGHPVDDDEQVRPGGLVRPPAAQLVDLGGEHPQRARPVAEPRVGVVRQPLDPLPRGQHRRCGDDGDPGIGRAVPQHELRDDGSGQRAGGFAVGFEPDRGRLLQRQGDRQLRHHGVRLQEAAQRERGDRLQPLGRPGLRRDQAGGQALGAAADAHVSEVGVGRAAFPQPPARDDGGPRFGLGMRGLRGDPLRGRCLLHRAPHLAEVAQVVAAPLVDGGRPRRAPAPAAGGHHAERRDREHAAEQPRRGVADAEDDDEAQRPGQHHQRQQPHQHAAGHHLLRLRWRLERQLARRWRWQLAVGPCDLDGAHEFLQTAPREGPRRRC